MKHIRILILEDDLETLSKLLEKLHGLEEQLLTQKEPQDIAVTILSEYTQVEEYINKTESKFDIVLLDRDCKAGGSFHALDIKRIGVDNVIAISSVPPYNEAAIARGVRISVHKDYNQLGTFTEKVIERIKELI